jgi:hypothetical protein
VRPGAYPRVEYLQGATLVLALALLAIIRLSWKGLPVINTLAYYENSKITDRKSFITLGPGANLIKLFFFVTDPSIKIK